MKIKIIALFSFALSAIAVHGQDLISKIPKESNFIAALNNKAVFKHLSIEDVNALFNRYGFFDQLRAENMTKIEDFGFDFSSKAYLFGQMTDSVNYVGGLIPLANAGLFEEFVIRNQKIELVNGLKTVYSNDRTLRVSWDKNTIYVLGGFSSSFYFQSEENIERFGIPEDPYAYDQVEAVEGIWDEVELGDVIDTVSYEFEEVEEEYLFDEEDEYAIVDSILAQDEYSDDYYSAYSLYTQQRDSIINEWVAKWVDEKMSNIISGNITSTTKRFDKMDDNTIAEFNMREFDVFYQALYSINRFMYTGFGFNQIPKLDFGITEASSKIVVDNNKLIFKGDISLDKEMTKYYKDIYSRKLNKKFAPFLNKDVLGFFSFNMNSEAYIKHLPSLVEKYYAPYAGQYSEALYIGTTLFDVLFDEKAIGKVFKGDNLLVLNGVTNAEVAYMDYEYDSDFNYTEVEKVKTETIPDFMWMFSSDDTRIFERLIKVGISENAIEDQNGLYAIEKKNYDPFQMFVLIKDGIVFLGNNKETLQAVQTGRYKGVAHKPYVNLAMKNTLAAQFNINRIPKLLTELDIPRDISMQRTIDELSEYGDFYIQSSGLKGNKLTVESGINFPNKEGNALAFIFALFNRFSY